MSQAFKRIKISETTMMSRFSPIVDKKVRKLTIRNFKPPPPLPETFEEDTWKMLKQAVHAIYEHKPIPYNLEELYKGCEVLCTPKYSKILYAKLMTEVEMHTKSLCATIDTNAVDFLTKLKSVWDTYCRQMTMIRSIFLYLDRSYVLHLNEGPNSLWDMGLDMFRKNVVESGNILNNSINDIIQAIQYERGGFIVDVSLLKGVVTMFFDLNLYYSHFEKKLLIETRVFYKKQATDNKAIPLKKYASVIWKYLENEQTRVEKYLIESSKTQLIKIVEDEMIVNKAAERLGEDFIYILKNKELETLKSIYDIYNRVNLTDVLKNEFSKFIKQKGESIVCDPSKDNELVLLLIQFHEYLVKIVSSSFQSNVSFNLATKDSFEYFINLRQNKPAELIAKFVDKLLRSKEYDETQLDNALTLFRFVQGKDIFEGFYKKDLAKRLLLGKSASIDVEKSVIMKLRLECGAEFTSKLEGMFKDMDISSDIMASFKENRMYSEKIKASSDINVSVLSFGTWPTYPSSECKLPKNMIESQEIFKDFYLNKYNGRKLKWENSMSTCIIKADFPLGPKELIVSLFQSLVILLFNENETLSLEQIQVATGIEQNELIRQVQSLCSCKPRILIRMKANPEDKSIEFKLSDKFKINEKFQTAHYRVRINTIQIKESVQEQQETNEKVIQDRQFLIDAAIVRIMKTRKSLSHTELSTTLFEMLKFPLNASNVKKRIESLIDKEYLKRDTKDPSLYHYLA
ncbi:Cullin-domain-containing protein [Rozella allomycis CSF55]|uniref:Cullin 4-like protein n=1 Tax=Rozella allomycis (strain CSF55) TaxID=988480 RepID=A0A075AMH3_ROZAC|nr:Cullin 4-like protein [Rozella allomycis CSF55]RKP21892.1 Cullin-domain-containing protein [Rozella allomycis CSF55]|eukprot:EPZ30829.1 Cullin 4-like protein [Rozella allomycis CSF55]